MREASRTIVCLFTMLTVQVCCADVILVERGAPRAEICLTEGATEAETAAASDIQNYIKKMSGAVLAIGSAPGRGMNLVEILGPSSDPSRKDEILNGKEALRPEGFAICSDGDKKISLVANDEPGIRFAANVFLEKLGVRWLMPGEIGEVVPRVESISFPRMREIQNPDFILRNVWYGFGGRPNWQRQAYAEWRMRNKMGGPHAGMGHNLFRIVPQKKFRKTHPEYFPEVSGVRLVPKTGENSGWQPCTSNLEVVALAVEAARTFFDQNPDAYSFSLSPNDGYGWCECKDCRSLDPPERKEGDRRLLSRRMVVFANAVATELAKTHPGKYVAFYAYAGTLEPPTDLKVHPNVIVPIAHYGWGGCNIHRVQDPNCENNVKFRKVLEGWAKVTDNIFIREYWTVVTREDKGLCRVAAAWSLADDIPFFKKSNVRGFSSESVAVWGIAGLNFYLAARIMWDSSLEPEEVLDDYFEKFYGPAAPIMREYFTTCRDKARERAHTGRSMVTDDDLAEAEEMLEKAAAVCATDAQRTHVGIAHEYVRFCRAIRTYGSVPTRENRKALTTLAKELSGTNSIDYTAYVARFEVRYKAQNRAEGAYTGGSLRPLSMATAESLPKCVCCLRGQHGWVILAKAGERIKARIELRRLGRYFSAIGWTLLDTEDKEIKSGTIFLGESADIDITAEKDGLYYLIVNSGRNAARVTIENRYQSIYGNSPHFLGPSGRLYFYVPARTQQFRLTLQTGSPGETGTMTIYDPDGNLVAKGDTTEHAIYAPVIEVSAGQDQQAWSFEISRAPKGTCEDNMLLIDANLPPLLSPSPERLLVPAK